MRSFAVAAVAMFAFGCGDVLKVPDAGPIDVLEPDSAMPFTCTAPETACNGSCANLMNSELYCGNCNTQCVPTEGCLNGACVPANTSCRRVRELDPSATDGVFINPNNNGAFYCDYAAGQQWEVVVTAYNTPPSGFQVARATDFANAAFVKAFIALYNNNIGFRVITAFSPSNCCMSIAAGLRYQFGPTYPFTGLGTQYYCNQPLAVGQYMSFYVGGSPPAASLPDSYFTTNPVTEVGGCSDANNASFFYRRTTI
jgi:hypothetical protein